MGCMWGEYGVLCVWLGNTCKRNVGFDLGVYVGECGGLGACGVNMSVCVV